MSRRQGRNSVSNSQSFKGRCRLGAQRVLGVFGARLKMGPQGPRAQIDRKLYKHHMQETLSNYPNLAVRAGSAFDLVLDHSAVSTSPAGPTSVVRGVRLGNELLSASAHRVNRVAPQILETSSSANQLLSARGLSYPGRSTSVE